MKKWKKNLIAAAVLVAVCAGIYVNWLYTEDQTVANLQDTLDHHEHEQIDKLEPYVIIPLHYVQHYLQLPHSLRFYPLD